MLECIVEFRKGIFFVRLYGELTKNTVSKLESEVTNLIKIVGIKNVVFNIQNLTKIDLKGINALFYNYEICKQNSGVSLLCGVNNNVNYIIKHSRILNYIKETENELSAFKIIKI